MFLKASSNAITLIHAKRGLKTSHKIIKKITSSSNIGKPKPKNVIHHHFCGFSSGTRQDNRKKNTTAIWV
jgi:hypothetical protein